MRTFLNEWAWVAWIGLGLVLAFMFVTKGISWLKVVFGWSSAPPQAGQVAQPAPTVAAVGTPAWKRALDAVVVVLKFPTHLKPKDMTGGQVFKFVGWMAAIWIVTYFLYEFARDTYPGAYEYFYSSRGRTMKLLWFLVGACITLGIAYYASRTNLAVSPGRVLGWVILGLVGWGIYSYTSKVREIRAQPHVIVVQPETPPPARWWFKETEVDPLNPERAIGPTSRLPARVEYPLADPNKWSFYVGYTNLSNGRLEWAEFSWDESREPKGMWKQRQKVGSWTGAWDTNSFSLLTGLALQSTPQAFSRFTLTVE